MAFVTPTNEQKAILQENTHFRNETKWAVFTLANYWKNQDGASLNAAQALNWRKHQYYSLGILASPGVIDADIAQWATQFAVESGNFQIVDDTVNPFDPEQAIDRMLANSWFEAIANLVFAQRLSTAL